jgi:transcriptional regulator with XRE-family HTH domain
MNHPATKKFAKTLKKMRLDHGLSQEQLAFKAKVSRNFIGMLERGERNITIAKLYDIAKAIGVDSTELLQ